MKSKKQEVIKKLFEYCKLNNNFEFHNDLVKSTSKDIGFGNHFDTTKLDTKEMLPDVLLKENYAIIHLGSGYHKFIKGVDKVYHNFEKINKEVEWQYKKSILNHYNESESNILSVANNQRILHDFTFGEDLEFENIDLTKRPKTYFPHRTKTNLEYYFGSKNTLILNNIQIEIDLTIEYNGIVGIFECKNNWRSNFAVYQIYHPFLYYYNAKKDVTIQNKIKNIICVYVVKETINKADVISLWKYSFEKPDDITSIKYLDSKSYKLIKV